MAEIAQNVAAVPAGEEEQVVYTSPIAQPLIGGKLAARTAKLLKKASVAKGVKRGMPEVTKMIRKGKQGFVVLAGDIFPIDLVAHYPVLCEEKNVLYVFVSTRRELAGAMESKRPVSVVFVCAPTSSDSPYEKEYKQVTEAVREMHPYMGTGKKKEAADEDGAAKKKKKRTAEVEGEAEGEEEAPKKKKKKQVAEE